MNTTYSISYLDKDNIWHNLGDTAIGEHIGIENSYDSKKVVVEDYEQALLKLGHMEAIKRLRIYKTETVRDTVEETDLMPWELKKVLENSILCCDNYYYKVARVEAYTFIVYAFGLGGPRHNFQYSLARASLKGNELYVYCGNELDKFQVFVPYPGKKESNDS